VAGGSADDVAGAGLSPSPFDGDAAGFSGVPDAGFPALPLSQPKAAMAATAKKAKIKRATVILPLPCLRRIPNP
jgi:hypothetical protein